ncbi:MAG: hypothetical protein ACKOZT_01840 [Cyanobium sp.]
MQSLGWAVLAAAGAGCTATSLALGVSVGSGQPLQSAFEPVLRAAACGFFYGLLAFHLQRVDPDDGHLQAGLVGAACALRCLSAPAPALPVAPSLMMGCARAWLPLWLPLVGSALLMHGVQRLLAAGLRSAPVVPSGSPQASSPALPLTAPRP